MLQCNSVKMATAALIASIGCATAQGMDASDGIGFASPHAAGVRQVSSPDAWGGPRTGSEPTLSDRVVNYSISAVLDPVRHTVDGTEQLTWRNRSHQEVRSVYLHLYLNAFEGPGSTFLTEYRVPGFSTQDPVKIRKGDWGHIALIKVTQGGSEVSWQFVHPDNGPETDHTVVRLDLATPVAPEASTTLKIAFLDQLPRVQARTGYFGTYHLIGQWFPKIGVLELPGERGATHVQWNVHEFHLTSEFYADYGLFDVKITVPTGYTVGATGEEQGEPVESKGLTTHRFVQEDVHDFAWTADSRTAKPLEGEYRGEGGPVVKVKVLYPPEYAVDGPPALKATLDALSYFSKTLGPYPYKTVTVVIPPYNAEGSAGMEYPTFFTADAYKNPKPDTLQGFELDFVTIHEFGHGYFYGILGSNEFEEPMLDEGLNDFWDIRMIDGRGERVSFGTPLTNFLGVTPRASGFQLERMGAARSNPVDGSGANSWDRFNISSYGSVYSRTATLLHDLEKAVGTDALERAFHEYYRRWRFRHPSIADFRETLAEVTNQRALVERVFNQQVYATERIYDAVEGLATIEELPKPGTSQVNGQWVELTQEDVDRQIKERRASWKKGHPGPKAVGGPFPYRTTLTVRRAGAAVPEEVQVKFADGSTEVANWDSDLRWQRFVWVKPVKAVSAELDYQGKNYLEANILDNGYAIAEDKSTARTFTGYLEAFIQTILALLAAI